MNNNISIEQLKDIIQVDKEVMNHLANQIKERSMDHSTVVQEHIIFINSLQHLIYGGLLLIGIIILFLFMYYLLKNENKNKSDTGVTEDVNEAVALFVVILFIISIVLFIISVINLTDIWNYIGVFDPSLALAHLNNR